MHHTREEMYVPSPLANPQNQTVEAASACAATGVGIQHLVGSESTIALHW